MTGKRCVASTVISCLGCIWWRRTPIRLVSWWGQQAVGEKKNELDAVAGLLGQLDLPGLVVTGDAQFTQRVVCQRVVAQGGTTSLR